ncbi:glycosyltransferase family 4 protein [Candidatus Fermentibacteria bacterium]|nr:glycosyltransferase family 4 protein [Candidatus Fermentibacteria bacterium]
MRVLLTRRFSAFHLTASDSRVLGFEVIVALASAIRHTPFIYNILAGRFGDRVAGYAPAHRLLLCFALRRAAVILVSNQAMAEHVRGLPLLSQVMVRVVGCRLPLGVPPQTDPDLAQFLHGGDPSIVAVGSLRTVYGFDLLIQACTLLGGSGCTPRILAIVSGRADPDAEAALERALGAAGDRVEMRTCHDLPRAIVLGAIQAADVLARPTRADGDSLSIHEALALGTPAVASDVVPRPDGVVMCRNEDPESLAEAIRTARSLHREPLGDAGETVVDRILACYEAVLGARTC